jgi:hypothetical protein
MIAVVYGLKGRARLTVVLYAPADLAHVMLRSLGGHGQVALWAGLRCAAGEYTWRQLSSQVFPEFTYPVPPAL